MNYQEKNDQQLDHIQEVLKTFKNRNPYSAETVERTIRNEFKTSNINNLIKTPRGFELAYFRILEEVSAVCFPRIYGIPSEKTMEERNVFLAAVLDYCDFIKKSYLDKPSIV